MAYQVWYNSNSSSSSRYISTRYHGTVDGQNRSRRGENEGAASGRQSRSSQ